MSAAPVEPETNQFQKAPIIAGMSIIAVSLKLYFAHEKVCRRQLLPESVNQQWSGWAHSGRVREGGTSCESSS